MKLRDWLNTALDHMIHLENGLALCCSRVEDAEQRDELLRAKAALLKALELTP